MLNIPGHPPPAPHRHIFRVLFTPHPEWGESVDKWRRCALGLSCLRSGEAIYGRALAGLTVINRRRPPRPQAGRGQPALHCLDREITSKRPAACVKKILHSGSAQMNPRRTLKLFLMASPSIYYHSADFFLRRGHVMTSADAFVPLNPRASSRPRLTVMI